MGLECSGGVGVDGGGGRVAVLQEWSFQPLIRMSKA